jgi:hypothetical protein
MVSEFQYPEEGRTAWSEKTSDEWHLYKADMEANAAEQEGDVLSVLAMHSGKPCSAALYTDAQTNDQDTFVLNKFIRNAGDDCKGGGAAILCHLIRNSHNRKSEFTPLKMFPIPGEIGLRRYYESFGCTEPSSLLGSILGIPMGDIPMFAGSVPLVCEDPNPKRCKRYADVVLDAETYFGNFPSGDSFSITRPHNVLNVAARAFPFGGLPSAMLLGFLVGSLAVLRFRRVAASTAGDAEEQESLASFLLAASSGPLSA